MKTQTREKNQRFEGKNNYEATDSKSMASLPLVLEKTEESKFRMIPAKENLPSILSNSDLEQYGSIAVMSPSVDQIRKMKEEKGATIQFGSFDIVKEEVTAIWFGRFDIGEGSINIAILKSIHFIFAGKTKAT